jgi:hypothetical protein
LEGASAAREDEIRNEMIQAKASIPRIFSPLLNNTSIENWQAN